MYGPCGSVRNVNRPSRSETANADSDPIADTTAPTRGRPVRSLTVPVSSLDALATAWRLTSCAWGRTANCAEAGSAGTIRQSPTAVALPSTRLCLISRALTIPARCLRPSRYSRLEHSLRGNGEGDVLRQRLV